MAQDIVSAAGPVRSRPAWLDPRLLLPAAALLLAALTGTLLAVRFVEAERARALLAWQVRLGIVADSRFAAVQGWLDGQFAELGGLADNAALQLYLTSLVAADRDPEAAVLAEAQADYLRNLLIVTAERAGFAPARHRAASPVGANVERVGVAGLALVDRAGRGLIATPGMPPLQGALADFVTGLAPASRGVLDLFLNPAGEPAMAFAVPVFAVQADPGASAQVGVVVGVKEVAGELYPLLRQPGEAAATARAALVRPAAAAIELLSPLPDGTPPLGITLARDTPELAAAFALERPGGFAIRRDVGGREVLLTSRAFAALPWTLLYQVDREEALAESDARLSRLLAILLLGLLLGLAALVAVWRHGSSLRAVRAAAEARALAGRLEAQRALLRIVTDSQPTAIFVLDAAGRYRFANRPAAAAAGMEPAEMIGKPVGSVLGPEAARRHLTLNRQALERGRCVTHIQRGDSLGRPQVVQSEHVPLNPASGLAPGVLVVERDITEAVTERERRARTLGQLVKTLVDILDRRDPYAADHSARVALVARAVALEMGLTATEIETAEIAGRLFNLGKILVAPDLLARGGPLSEAERAEVRRSLQASADLLQGVEFDGPVVETLRQVQAHWDGSGTPAGLAGEQILATARAVAVANAFVGMASARAHRGAIPLDRAVETLLAEVGRAFDRRAVAALVNYLDSRGGRARWAVDLDGGPAPV